MSALFEKKLKGLDIELSEKQKQQFVDYYELLVERNKVMNLTGITEYEEVNEKHFVDSLSLTKAQDMSKVNEVMDVGTGAGFPGIPLKIAFPHLEVVLLDSLQKRVKFLNEVIEKLELVGIKAIHGRAEDYARQEEYRGRFDLCVSRAVANLSTLAEFCLPYVNIGGHFIPYKSGEIETELNASTKAIQILGGSIQEVVKFQLPESDISRSFVMIVKKKATAKKYPRKAGLPAKEPL